MALCNPTNWKPSPLTQVSKIKEFRYAVVSFVALRCGRSFLVTADEGISQVLCHYAVRYLELSVSERIFEPSPDDMLIRAL